MEESDHFNACLLCVGSCGLRVSVAKCSDLGHKALVRPRVKRSSVRVFETLAMTSQLT